MKTGGKNNSCITIFISTVTQKTGNTTLLLSKYIKALRRRAENCAQSAIGLSVGHVL